MPDRMEIKPEHTWITSLIARGIARADEAGLAFHAGGHPDAAEADRELRREYMEEAYDILRGTGRIDELALMEKLVQGASEKSRKRMNIDELEAWIAEREAKVARIEQHLHVWDRGGFEGRDSAWAERARKAVQFTERQIRFGYNLRLTLTREGPRGVDPALQARIGQLETARAAERERRDHLVGRQKVETDALKNFLRARAPHLLEQAYAICDAAVQTYDQDRSFALKDRDEEPDPSP